MVETLKISIITVCYNAVDTIEKTILSVLNQTYANIEYILIDGGSIDGTVDIIEKYANQLAYWVSEPDEGIYDAMNKGIDKAVGTWINFMNSGDSFASNDVLLKIFESQNYGDIGVIYGNVLKRYGEKNIIVRPGSIDRISKHLPFCHQASFVKKDLMNTHFDLKYDVVADDDFFYRQYLAGIKFEYIDVVVANYEALYGYSSSNFKKALWQNYIIRGGENYVYWYIFIYLKMKIRHRIFLLLRLK